MKPVNLNKHRKAKARAEKRARADENAVKFGRNKAEKTRDEATRTAQIARLEAHRRDDP